MPSQQNLCIIVLYNTQIASIFIRQSSLISLPLSMTTASMINDINKVLLAFYHEQNKQMNKQTQRAVKKTIKQYNKSNCQLSQFPIIKLHIFNEIQILNLSNNIISNLSSLTIHSESSQYALANLKIVNLSQNQFKSVADLQPLAATAKNIVSLNIEANPLVNNLNFAYEIAILFTSLSNIKCGFDVEVDHEVRSQMVKQQQIGGKMMCQFLQLIKSKTQNVRYLKIEKQQSFIAQMLQKFQQPLYEISEQNRRIFQQIDLFISQSTPFTSVQHTYRSPQTNRHYPRNNNNNQIEIMSQYQITKQSNNLIRYLTESDEKPINLNHFYYQDLVFKKSIYAKIIQQIEVEQEILKQLQAGNPDAITYQQLFLQINKKWTNNLALTQKFEGKVNNHKSYSPLKSIQTDMTSRINRNIPFNIDNLDNQYLYFGLDREWSRQTQNFIKHRLLSLLRIIQKQKTNGYLSPIQIFKSYLDSNQLTKNKQSQANYQTFGAFHIQTIEFQPEQKHQIKVVSPKSKNKFIIGSLVNILQQVIKKIVYRKILQTKLIQIQDIKYLEYVLIKFDKKHKEAAFRKIFEASVFYQCLQDKMDAFKKKIVFKAWKQLKKRKIKLLKTILNRKNKKEKAFLSVFITQLRINARNIGLQQRISHSKAEFQRQSFPLQDISSILRRSTTLKQKTKQFDNQVLIKKCYRKYSTLKK